MALEVLVLSLLCTFENSSNCIITSFDSEFYPRIAKRSMMFYHIHMVYGKATSLNETIPSSGGGGEVLD